MEKDLNVYKVVKLSLCGAPKQQRLLKEVCRKGKVFFYVQYWNFYIDQSQIRKIKKDVAILKTSLTGNEKRAAMSLNSKLNIYFRDNEMIKGHIVMVLPGKKV